MRNNFLDLIDCGGVASAIRGDAEETAAWCKNGTETQSREWGRVDLDVGGCAPTEGHSNSPTVDGVVPLRVPSEVSGVNL